MKRILTILILTLVSVSLTKAQNSNTKKADRLYDKFKFVKASQEYLKLVKDFPEDVDGTIASLRQDLETLRKQVLGM